MKVSVCAYDSSVGVGGPYVWMQRMPLELRERGFDVSVRLFRWEAPEEGILFRALHEQGFGVHSQLFGNSESNVRWLLQSMAADPPDVLIADNVIPGLLSGRYLRPCGISTVGILRSDDAFYHGIIERFVAGDQRDQLSAVVSVSEFMTDTVRERRIRNLITETIPSGSPIPAETTTAPKDVLRVVYVGRLVQEQKRIIETVEALIRVVKEIHGVHVTIFGDGPERGRVQELILPYTSKISLAGNVPPKELQHRLLDSHVIALLSDYEGTPTAIMEAMACGVVPVVIKIRSGIPELVLHGETGMLVDNRESAFLAAMHSLKNDAILWSRLSQSARIHIEKNYSTDFCADRWADLLRQLAGRNDRRPSVIVPRHLKLAPRHAAYAHQDVRRPGILARSRNSIKHGYRRLRIYLGRIRRLMFRMPIP